MKNNPRPTEIENLLSIFYAGDKLSLLRNMVKKSEPKFITIKINGDEAYSCCLGYTSSGHKFNNCCYMEWLRLNNLVNGINCGDAGIKSCT